MTLSPSWRAGVRNVLIYGVCGGLLFAVLRLTEYRFLVLEHWLEIYGGLVAALFSALGIWLGITLTRNVLFDGGHRRRSNTAASCTPATRSRSARTFSR
jgi:hypothetical protein